MDDRGEKIVFLARAMLEAEPPAGTVEKKPVYLTVTFKVLCLLATLAMGGGALAAGFSYKPAQPLDRYQKLEVRALLFYVAQHKGLDEEALREEVEQTARVDDLDDLTRDSLPVVQRYLQEKWRDTPAPASQRKAHKS